MIKVPWHMAIASTIANIGRLRRREKLGGASSEAPSAAALSRIYMHTFLSCALVTKPSPSGVQSPRVTNFWWSANTCKALPVVVSTTHDFPSIAVTSNRFRCTGFQSTDRTGALITSIVRKTFFEATSVTLTLLSVEPLAMRDPSGLNRAQMMLPACKLSKDSISMLGKHGSPNCNNSSSSRCLLASKPSDADVACFRSMYSFSIEHSLPPNSKFVGSKSWPLSACRAESVLK
mmetsp:Transcript_17539/g.41300  ORF Transcript_17539/g.41300 Transcript_17539/m.41300 type:complete len:233 (+) Transcript_17539:413-1111(+)